MKSVIRSTFVVLILVAGFAGVISLSKAYADATFDLSGDVPSVNTLELAWSNQHFGLGAGTGGPATFYRAVAAVKVYSNDPNGFTISVAGLAAGVLTGTTTAATVSYDVSLADTEANAESGTTTLAPGGAGKVDATYVSPIVAGNLIMNSGVIATPYDTGANALWISCKFLLANTTTLMADTYTDTLTVSMVGL